MRDRAIWRIVVIETAQNGSAQNEWMYGALRADGPHPDVRDEVMLFGQFVGVWDMDIWLWNEAGQQIFHRPGEWSFGYIIDGRGIQDVIITPNSEGSTKPGERGIGTTVRYYDPALSAWRAVFIGASTGTFIRLIARKDGDEIRLEGGDDQGELVRWTFSDIHPDRFHWTGMTSSDGGATWWKEQEMAGARRG